MSECVCVPEVFGGSSLCPEGVCVLEGWGYVTLDSSHPVGLW